MDFDKQKKDPDPNPHVIRICEEALAHARADDFKACAFLGVTPDGASAMRFVHSGSTISSLLAANRMLENALVQALAGDVLADEKKKEEKNGKDDRGTSGGTPDAG